MSKRWILKKHGSAQLHESADCPICGRAFSPASYHDWYVDEVLVCSYTCQRKGEREGWCRNPRGRAKRRTRGADPAVRKRAIDLVLKEGMTCKEAAAIVGYRPNTVSAWVRNFLEEEG